MISLSTSKKRTMIHEAETTQSETRHQQDTTTCTERQEREEKGVCYVQMCNTRAKNKDTQREKEMNPRDSDTAT